MGVGIGNGCVRAYYGYLNMRLDNFRLTDICKVRDMFCEAFELDCYSKSSFVMRHLLDHYLCGYLTEADYAVTLRMDGRVAGFLLGCDSSRNGKRIYRLLRLYHKFFLPFFRGGRSYIRCKRLIEDADSSMRAEAPAPEGELILFVVRKDLRGQGVGRNMLLTFRDWLIKREVRNMQLFTDDYSDVDYYRTRGYEQLGVRNVEFAPGIDSYFYLFSIPTEQIGMHRK